jgi:hypothetical protein
MAPAGCGPDSLCREQVAIDPRFIDEGLWKDALQMADKRALKLIGIIFATLTLMAISAAAAVVAGYAASSANGEYVKLVDLRD